MSHQLVIGAPRFGKSFMTLMQLIEVARSGQAAILLNDLHGPLASGFMQYLVRLGLEDRVIYDRLKDPTRVLGWKLLCRPVATDPYKRELEEDFLIRRFMDVLLVRRGEEKAHEHPYYEHCLFGLKLWMRQKEDVPPTMLRFALKPERPEFWQLVNGCNDKETVFEALEINDWTKTRKERELEPAGRLIKGLLSSPVLRSRLGTEFDAHDWYDQKGIVIVEGDLGISKDAARSHCIAVMHDAIAYKAKGGKTPLMIVVDEFANYDMATPQLILFLKEYEKTDTEIVLIDQTLTDLPEPVARGLLQATSTHTVFRCNDSVTALLFADDMGIPLLNEKRIHYIEERWRQVHDGYDELEMDNDSTWWREGGGTGGSTGKRITFRPRYDERREEVKHYMALRDQILLTGRDIMNLNKRECFRKTPDGVWLVKTDILQPAFPRILTQSGLQRTEDAIRKIMSKPCYRFPKLEKNLCLPSPRKGTNGYSNSSRSTSARSGNASESSSNDAPTSIRRTRKHNNGSNGSGKKSK